MSFGIKIEQLYRLLIMTYYNMYCLCSQQNTLEWDYIWYLDIYWRIYNAWKKG